MKVSSKFIIDLILYFIVLISLYFVVCHLKISGMLVFPKHIDILLLTMSFVALLCGFLFQCWSWMLILKNNGIRVNFLNSFVSMGVPILGKYIPGKVWLISGMGSKVASMSGAAIGKVLLVTTLFQVLIIIMGSIVGLASISRLIGVKWVISLYLVIICMGVLFFRGKNTIMIWVQRFPDKVLKFLLPFIDSLSWPLVIIVGLLWLSWSAGFYLLSLSVGISRISFVAGLSFSLAASMGIVMVFAPGGLGVREGLIGVILATYLMENSDIASLAAMSRLWFLIGELTVFFVAIVLSLIGYIYAKSARVRFSTTKNE